MTLQSFATIAALLAAKRTDLPVYCFHPQRLRDAAQSFIAGFPGEVLYAVKANADPRVLGWLVEGGIRYFDTASVPEIAAVRAALPAAQCSFNHPVKPRAAIVAAYRDWGVRDFVVDHGAELEKLLAEVGAGIVVQVRVAAPNPCATVSFNSKFGATPQAAAALLRAVMARGATPAVSMHVGYQSTDPAAFGAALALVAAVIGAADVTPAYVNVGGGFPSILMPPGRRLQDFFDAIRRAQEGSARLAGLKLRCEPGSALAHPGGSVLAQVTLVKEDAVYLNDGVYGALAEQIHSRIQPPTRVLSPDGTARGGALRGYTVFGPTCDSYDAMPSPYRLPASIREGDWLHLGLMGAYSMAVCTDFNGVGAHEYAIVDDPAA